MKAVFLAGAEHALCRGSVLFASRYMRKSGRIIHDLRTAKDRRIEGGLVALRARAAGNGRHCLTVEFDAFGQVFDDDLAHGFLLEGTKHEMAMKTRLIFIA